MSLNVSKSAFEPTTPLLRNGLAVEDCDGTIFDRFFYFLLEGFSVKLSKVAGHFTAPQNC